MKARKYLIALLFILPVHADAQPQEMSLGIYVVVSDLDASRSFYQSVFGKAPYFENESFSGFNIGGSLFGIFQEEAFTHELVRGNNSVPYIQVGNIESEFLRIREIAAEMIHEEVLVEGPVKLFMFKDPDGNAIEFYSIN